MCHVLYGKEDENGVPEYIQLSEHSSFARQPKPVKKGQDQKRDFTKYLSVALKHFIYYFFLDPLTCHKHIVNSCHKRPGTATPKGSSLKGLLNVFSRDCVTRIQSRAGPKLGNLSFPCLEHFRIFMNAGAVLISMGGSNLSSQT